MDSEDNNSKATFGTLGIMVLTRKEIYRTNNEQFC
jgi:hypothetical protein